MRAQSSVVVDGVPREMQSNARSGTRQAMHLRRILELLEDIAWPSRLWEHGKASAGVAVPP